MQNDVIDQIHNSPVEFILKRRNVSQKMIDDCKVCCATKYAILQDFPLEEPSDSSQDFNDFRLLPLHIASLTGNAHELEHLINKVNSNATICYGFTALHLAHYGLTQDVMLDPMHAQKVITMLIQEGKADEKINALYHNTESFSYVKSICDRYKQHVQLWHGHGIPFRPTVYKSQDFNHSCDLPAVNSIKYNILKTPEDLRNNSHLLAGIHWYTFGPVFKDVSKDSMLELDLPDDAAERLIVMDDLGPSWYWKPVDGGVYLLDKDKVSNSISEFFARIEIEGSIIHKIIEQFLMTKNVNEEIIGGIFNPNNKKVVWTLKELWWIAQEHGRSKRIDWFDLDKQLKSWMLFRTELTPEQQWILVDRINFTFEERQYLYYYWKKWKLLWDVEHKDEVYV